MKSSHLFLFFIFIGSLRMNPNDNMRYQKFIKVTSKYSFSSSCSEYWNIQKEIDYQTHIYFSQTITSSTQSFSATFCLPISQDMVFTLYYRSEMAELISYSSISLYNQYNTLFARIQVSDIPKEGMSLDLSNVITNSVPRLYTSTGFESWYLPEYETKSWVSIVPATSQKERETVSDYYRFEFSCDHVDLLAAFTIGIFYHGNLELYLNGHLLYQVILPSSEVMTDELYKYVFSANLLQSNNLLAVRVYSDQQTLSSYLNLFLIFNSKTLYAQCSYPIDSIQILNSVSVPSPNNPLSSLFDFDFQTRWIDTSTSSIILEIEFSNHTYLFDPFLEDSSFIQFNQFAFPKTMLVSTLPSTFFIFGRNSDHPEDDYTLLSFKEDVRYSYNSIFLSQIAPTLQLYNQLRIEIHKNAGGFVTSLNEWLLLVCNAETHPLAYSNNYNRFYYDLDPVVLSLTYHEYYYFTIDPPLPEGLVFDSIFGTISGKPAQPLARTTYTIQSLFPLRKSLQFELEWTYCSFIHLKLDRYYGSSMTQDHTFGIMNTKTREILLSDNYTSVFHHERHTYFEICAPPGTYVPVFYNKVSLPHDSYLTIYIQHFHDSQGIQSYEHSTLLGNYTLCYPFSVPSSFSLNYYLTHDSLWRYAQNTLPDHWYLNNFDDSSWSVSSYGHFDPLQHLEIYRTTFFVSGPVDTRSGLELILSYMYGIIIYINEQEVFSHRIIKPVTLESNSTSYYTTNEPRVVVISSSCLREGTNYISVLLLTDGQEQVDPVQFDLSIRDLGSSPTESFTQASVYSDSFYDVNNLHDHSFNTSVFLFFNESILFYQPTLDYTTITYYSVYVPEDVNWENHPHSWTLQGRYYEMTPDQAIIQSPWVTIHSVSNYTWSFLPYPEYFVIPEHSRAPFNQYRLTNLSNDYDVNDALILSEITFYSSSTSFVDVPFDYVHSTIDLLVGVFCEPVELTNGIGFFSYFSSVPPLPEGLYIDDKTGRLLGRPIHSQAMSSYIIFAHNMDNQSVYTVIHISVHYDSLKRYLLGVSFRIPYRDLYDTFSIQDQHDRGSSLYIHSNLLPYYSTAKSMDLRRNNATYYIVEYYMYLTQSLYTLSIKTDLPSFAKKSFYRITGGRDSVLAMEFLSTQTAQLSVDLNLEMPLGLYSYSPITYTANEQTTRQWTASDFDDYQWTQGRTGVLMASSSIYLRHKFQLETYNYNSSLMLKVYVNTECDLFVNGLFVIHYVPSEEDRAYLPSLDNDIYVFSITIPMQTLFVTKRNNVLSLKLYKLSASYTAKFYYNAELFYLPGSCATVTTRFNSIRASSVLPQTSPFSLFDSDFMTHADFDTRQPVQIQIEFPSRMTSYFNNVFLYFAAPYGQMSITIYGREKESFSYQSLLNNYSFVLNKDDYVKIHVPKGIIGYRYVLIQLQLQSPESATTLSISEISLSFCSHLGRTCVGDEDFLTVGEDEYSYAFCGYGYEGYKMKYCDGIRFGSILESNCTMLKPENLRYNTTGRIVTYRMFEVPPPTFDNYITRFTVEPPLPLGLSLGKDGSIFGIVYIPFKEREFLITGYNDDSQGSTRITLSAVAAMCPEEDGFMATEVGNTIVTECQPGFVGSVQRACIARDNNVFWNVVEERCTSVFLIFTIIVLLCITVVCVIFIFLYTLHYKQQMKELSDLRKRKGTVIVKDDSHILYDKAGPSHSLTSY